MSTLLRFAERRVMVVPRSGVDYASDQITVYRDSCPYQCRYCWAWRVPLMVRRIQHGGYDPVEEAKRYVRMNGGGRVIVVSFTNDPYPPRELSLQLTRRVLEVLALARRHRVLILTKNPVLALRDLDLMQKHGDMWLGTTITSLEANELEPYALSPGERLRALREAKLRGIKTWLSIEPIIPYLTFPEDIVEETVDFIDWYVLGAFNYYGQLKLHFGRYVHGNITRRDLVTWYSIHVPKAIKILEEHQKPFHIKRELRRVLEVNSNG